MAITTTASLLPKQEEEERNHGRRPQGVFTPVLLLSLVSACALFFLALSFSAGTLDTPAASSSRSEQQDSSTMTRTSTGAAGVEELAVFTTSQSKMGKRKRRGVGSKNLLERAGQRELEPVTTAPPPETSTAPPPETTTVPPPETTTVPPPETTTVPPPETTTVPPPETTTAPPPETTTAPPPETTTAPPPETTTAPPPETTTVPPPETTTAPPPETTTAPPPETTTAPPPETTTVPPPETTTVPPPETTTAPPPETTTAPPPETTTAPPPETTTALPTTAPPTVATKSTKIAKSSKSSKTGTAAPPTISTVITNRRGLLESLFALLGDGKQEDEEDEEDEEDPFVICGMHEADSCDQCPMGNGKAWCHGDCAWNDDTGSCESAMKNVHPDYSKLIRLKPFQGVRDEHGRYVNIILVRMMFTEPEHELLYQRYKDEILFLGIMSFESFPLPSPNPRTFQYHRNKYLSMFPGWLNMYRSSDISFPSHVSVLNMSQSDFTLPGIDLEEEQKEGKHIKRFDFAYAMSDLNVTSGECDSWGAFAKNWSFVRDHALDILCGDLGMTGVLMVTRDEKTNKACDIPPSCEGKILQTPFVAQSVVFDYMRQSRFMLLPQVYDASPRVAAQAMTMNIPLLMNKNIVGGWKYVNDQTGEFFHDASDFRASVERLMGNLDQYSPHKYVTETYGDKNAGRKLRAFVEEKFGDRVQLPESELLIPIFS